MQVKQSDSHMIDPVSMLRSILSSLEKRSVKAESCMQLTSYTMNKLTVKSKNTI